MTGAIKKENENRGTILDCVELRLERRRRVFRKQQLYALAEAEV